MMRKLTPEEIELLKSQGNRAEKWDAIDVDEHFEVSNIWDNVFGENVRIAALEDKWLSDGDTQLKSGIVRSYLRNCEIGLNSAVYNVALLDGYKLGEMCLVMNVNELVATNPEELKPVPLEVMNENGGRYIYPFAGMTIADATLWARYRGRKQLMEKLESAALQELHSKGLCVIGAGAVVKNSREIKNVAVLSSLQAPSKIYDCTVLTDGVVGYGCRLEYGIIAQRFLLGENVKLEYGLRLNDTVVGDNSTLARCEIGNSIIFPSHEQHHNNSFLIAGLIQGQSNIAAGGTLGSNHNGRTADNELAAGRGFWPGLCVSVKHSSRFASYTLLAKADYPAELDIRLPFALVNNNVCQNRLEVMPAYWWMYNMYALNRNIRKFAQRDKRYYKVQHIEFDPFAPDTAEEMLEGRRLLEVSDYGKNRLPFEHGKREVVILKPEAGYKAYEDMIVYYAMRVISSLPAPYPLLTPEKGEREKVWINLGGQLVAGTDMEVLIADVENGTLSGWADIHSRLDLLWEQYPAKKQAHAYKILCALYKVGAISQELWDELQEKIRKIEEFVEVQRVATRRKDEENPFRNMTYWDEDERLAVLG